MKMNNKPKFTIAIPAYKARFLNECITSILQQTYSNFELVIVNDASPEDLDSIVFKFNDNRIKYYKNERNIGAINVVDNWNKCLGYANGDFIICMGDDDKLAQNALCEYVRLILKYPKLDAFHSRTILINENNEYLGIINDRSEYESVWSLMRHRFEGAQQFIGDFCFKTKKLREIGGYFNLPLAWGADDITSFLCANPNGVANTYLPTFFYRVSPITISNRGQTQIKLKSHNRMWEWIHVFISSECSVNNDIDLLTLKALRSSFENAKSNSLMWDIYTDLNKSLWRIFYWFFVRHKYNLSISILLKAFLKKIKNHT